MDQICGDFRPLSRRQLYSLISELKREISRLSTDLLKYKLLSNDCLNYLKFFEEMNETIETNTEKHFISQINALRHSKLFHLFK